MAVLEFLSLLSVVVVLLYLWLKRNYSYWERRGVPFIKPIPFLGNVHKFFSLKSSFGIYLSEVCEDEKFRDAPVIGLYILTQPGLIVRDLELVKSVLIKDFNKFSNRFSSSDPHGDVLGANNLFFVRNPYWRDIRTKLTPVFTSGKVKKMYPLMLEIAGDLEKYLARHMQNRNSFETEIKEVCALFTTDMISTIAYGIKANSLENPQNEFRTRGREMFNFTLKRGFDFFIVFCLPKLAWFFRVKVMTREFTDFLRRTVNYVMTQRESSGSKRNDLIDILVNLKQEGSLKGIPTANSNDFLVAQAAVFFTAGFETSSSTMTFALYELAKRPDLQERLREEINDALLDDNGTISYEKIQNMEYLSMVVDEVLRLYPVLPFLDRAYSPVKGESNFTLKPFHDCELKDGMPVYIPIYSIQRDPKYWHNPNVFDPERFSSENKKTINPMSYIPFGTGPHNCIGNRIGLLQAKLGLVHILKNHYVGICDNTLPAIKFDPKAFILQCEGGVYLKVIKDDMFTEKLNKI